MNTSKEAVTDSVLGYASRMRFPKLFMLTTVLFLIDLVVPDVIPLVDEILLGLATLLLASLRTTVTSRLRTVEQPPAREVH